MHPSAQDFLQQIKHRYPERFRYARVLDCGSLDINGNNRRLFSDQSSYWGIDLCKGRNVDEQIPAHLFQSRFPYTVVISTEMLEHDMYWKQSLRNMFSLLSPDGLLILTAAGHHRPEHGTYDHNPADSPMTPAYYRNFTPGMLTRALDLSQFSFYEISYYNTDFRFFGFKD